MTAAAFIAPSSKSPSWMQWLLDAAALKPADPRARYATCWGGSPSNSEPEPNPAKHEAYVKAMREATDKAIPGLTKLFDLAAATVVLCPGLYVYYVPQHFGVAVPIPELEALTFETPFPTAETVLH